MATEALTIQSGQCLVHSTLAGATQQSSSNVLLTFLRIWKLKNVILYSEEERGNHCLDIKFCLTGYNLDNTHL